MRGRGAGKELTTEVAEDTERECFEVSLKELIQTFGNKGEDSAS